MRGPGQSGREPDQFEEVQEGGGRLGKLWLRLGERAGTRASEGLVDCNEDLVFLLREIGGTGGFTLVGQDDGNMSALHFVKMHPSAVE